MLLKPSVSKDDILLSEISYCKVSPLRVILVVKNNIHHLLDRASLVWSAIHIIHWNWAAESPHSDFILLHIVPVHKKTSSSTVNQSIDQFYLLSVHGDYFNLEV